MPWRRIAHVILVTLAAWLGSACGGSGEMGEANRPEVPTPSVTVLDNPCESAASETIAFSVPSGTFERNVTVELQAPRSSAEIRYTVDHTPPTADSPLYSEPLSFDETTELRAQVFEDTEPFGSPRTAIYIARSFDEEHELPVLVLDSFGRAVPGADPGWEPDDAPFSREYVSAALLSFEPANGVTALNAQAVVASGAGVHVRGQSSVRFDKKPYRVELRDATDADRDCAMFGMPTESDWVLSPPFPDKALIRNAFVYSLGPDMGLAAPRARLVEVYVNSEPRALAPSDYQGVYLFVETIKNQKHRLDLQQLEPSDTTLPDIQGGYIFKFEWQSDNIEQRLVCPAGAAYCWDWLEVADPKPWNDEQQAYLASHLVDVSAAFHAEDPADLELGYPAFIDTASFVNQVIIHELTRNMDGYVRSQYFHKDRGTKVFAGPLWDFDISAGVGSSQGSYQNVSLEGWQHENFESRSETADWFHILLADPSFRDALATRWRELRQNVLSDDAIALRIQTLTRDLAGAAQRNFERWPILTSQYIEQFETPTADSWQAQVRVMQEWLLGRAAWLDSQW